ncbi:rhodanese-like domain-containing protein [Paralcaligenes ureilyticus]|uniref:Rhodanese-related sulfurtransferase n=1 Tax=Paralcaligenes ureilyticus TaxID=627131 RepID=A0A4R3MCS8_9BURK|nr:rhodanese-like domain-containing protein [Paralcaligenes ureilyticus]TCT11236.1 rhodanese-related sulfurtransferase [Paralcaligenes ureilyticus]
MDFLLSQNNLYILIIALVSGGMLLWPNLRKSHGSSGVSVPEAVQLANQKQAVFIDVRSAEQFKTGSIPQARNLPAADIQEKLASLPKNKPIIVVCDQGRDSARVAATLRKQGMADVFSLDGGVRNWASGGLPLSKKA